MKPLEIKSIISKFINLIENSNLSREENETELEFLLDSLSFAQHFVTYQLEDNEYPEARRIDQEILRAKISNLFPSFSFYNRLENSINEIKKNEIIIGDAIDDILDIANELYDVLWLWDNTSQANALWYFQNNNISHWKEHLRGLQIYLYQNKS